MPWSPEHFERTWVSLDSKDHCALLQLLERAERAGEIKKLTTFIRMLLRQSGLPIVLENQKRIEAQSRMKAKQKAS